MADGGGLAEMVIEGWDDDANWPFLEEIKIEDLAPDAQKTIASIRRPMAADDPRRHHFVPKFYLKRFASGDFITRISLREPDIRPTVNVSGVAVIKDFYTVLDEEIGETAAVEGVMAIIDGAAVAPLARLAMGVLFPPQPDDRGDLAMWFSSLYFRGPQTRRQAEAVVDMAMKAQYALLKHDGNARAHLRQRNGGAEPSDDEVRELQASVEQLDDLEIAQHQNQHIQQMLDLMDRCMPLFAMRYWTVVKFDEPGVFLSDKPIITYLRPENRDGLKGHGLPNADELWMPLDRKTALIMHSNQSVGNRVVRDKYGVDNFNQTVLASGAQEIYCHPDDARRLDDLRIPPPDQPLMTGGMPSWISESTDGLNSPPRRRTHLRYRRDPD